MRVIVKPPDDQQGAFQERLGGAYGDHGLFKEAIEHYQRAAESEDTSSSATLRVIEQWINLAVRLGEKEGNKSRIEAAVEKGRHLLGMATTSERLNLMGSAHKKLAQCETDVEKVKDHLRQSAAYYREAASRPQHDGVVDPYSTMNALVAEALLRKEDPGRDASLARCESLVQQRFNQTRSACDAITIAEIALIQAFLRQSLPQEQESLAEKYRSAFAESSATSREQDSALTQMEFVRSILGKLSYPDQVIVESAIQSLEYIQQYLQPYDQMAGSAAGEPKQKDQRSRSPKASAKQPARKSPVREKRTGRPTRRGKGKA